MTDELELFDLAVLGRREVRPSSGQIQAGNMAVVLFRMTVPHEGPKVQVAVPGSGRRCGRW